MESLLRYPDRHRLDSGVFSPLSLAAYATWAILMTDLWSESRDGDGPRAWLGLAAGVVFLVAFVLRELSERMPHARLVELSMLALQAVSALVAVRYSGSGAAAVFLVIFAAQLAARVPMPVTIGTLVACNIALYFVYATTWEGGRPLFATALYAGFQAFAVMTMRLAADAERARDALAATNAELVATRSLLDESARAGERLRMSRELHDVAGHGLTALKLNLELADRTPEPERARRIRLSIDLADQLLADLRGMVGQLRRHDGVDVAAALAALAQRMPGLQVDLQLDPELRLPTLEQGEALLRCVQEALTNAARHAHAKRVVVRVERHADRVRVTIADDGRGAAKFEPGNGIAGMRERIGALGGEVAFSTAPGRGFVVDATLPAA
ncbi:MAG TPA: sensor histidine kinase [Xanthomonadales bacterium]|nr:sensor histidine kinase [Xanthomonadales bacterium]